MALDHLPKDPMMLLSFVNTTMRDDGIDLDALCARFGVKRTSIEETLDKIGYTYNSMQNRFL
ncbi:MAG: DUF4250 domain-containing protein [Eubacteriales bacterium]|nr:DUF4250 domain-containing protein [Lachnospiraceae bacterium]MDO5126414.1 DUF4250 domain-containing protein [Eubacteriales bacterium]